MKIKEKKEYDFFLFLINILNSDLDKLEDSLLVSKLFEYSKYIGQFADRYSMISPNRYANIMSGLASDEEIMAEQRQGLHKWLRLLNWGQNTDSDAVGLTGLSEKSKPNMKSLAGKHLAEKSVNSEK